MIHINIKGEVEDGCEPYPQPETVKCRADIKGGVA